MWIFTKEGYFSIGCGVDMDGCTDPTVKMVRARCPQQLERLKCSYPEILFHKKITRTFETDYSYRIVLDTDILCNLLCAIGDNIDYGNFKDTALESNPADFHYINLLHKIWEMWYLVKGGFEQKLQPKKGKVYERTKKRRKKKND